MLHTVPRVVGRCSTSTVLDSRKSRSWVAVVLQWGIVRSFQFVPEMLEVGARVRLSSLCADSSPLGDSIAVRAQGTHWDANTAL